MSSGIKGIVGALVIVLFGLLLTPTVVGQVNSISAAQTCPTGAKASLKSDNATATATTLVTQDVEVAIADNPNNGFYRAGTLCAIAAFTASEVTADAEAAKLVRAAGVSGTLAYDSSGAKDIVNLVKIIWVIGVLGGAVGFVYMQFRSSRGM
ncbi:MAG: hypothetical protein J4G14_02505 [Dehalococcoidia bacterium]|nr:hypothetical protein [Dehalococcoidia bacterium]